MVLMGEGSVENYSESLGFKQWPHTYTIGDIYEHFNDFNNIICNTWHFNIFFTRYGQHHERKTHSLG